MKLIKEYQKVCEEKQKQAEKKKCKREEDDKVGSRTGTDFCFSSFSAEGRPFDHIPNSVSDKESFGEENDGSASASGRAAVAPYISGLY